MFATNFFFFFSPSYSTDLPCSGELPFTSDSPSSNNYPSLASLYDIGELDVKQDTNEKWSVKWKLSDYFTLPQYMQITQFFGSKNFWFHIYLTPKGIYDLADITELKLNWRFKSSPVEESSWYPKFSVHCYFKTNEGKLYSLSESTCHVAKYGGYCRSLISRREIIDRRNSLVHEGDLAIVVAIRRAIAPEVGVSYFGDFENSIVFEDFQGKCLFVLEQTDHSNMY